MSRLHSCAALFALLLALPRLGAAVPVTASFDGTVTGHEVGYAPQIVSDVPLGTQVSWSFTFDDAFTALDLNALLTTPQPSVTGSATIGANTYSLTGMSLFSASYDPATSSVLSYRYQVNGTGPLLPSGADFFGLWLTFDPALNLSYPWVGFTYRYPNAEIYGYATTTGEYRLDRTAQVPEPSSFALLLAALALIGAAARGRRHAARG